MPNKVYQLNRVLGGMDGKGQMVIPVRVYDSLETAKEAAKLRTAALQKFIRCRLIDQTGENRGVDTGVNLGQFLEELGIAGFQHVVDGHEVHAGELIAQPPPPSIIIPG